MSDCGHQDVKCTGGGPAHSQYPFDHFLESKDAGYRQSDGNIDYEHDDVVYQRPAAIINPKPDDTPNDYPTQDAGITIGIQELYRADKNSAWRSMAVDMQQKIEDMTREKQYALIIRREKVSEESGLVLHSITVKCPLMRKILGRVFERYEGINMKLKEITFAAPFREFYYRWHRFEKPALSSMMNNRGSISNWSTKLSAKRSSHTSKQHAT